MFLFLYGLFQSVAKRSSETRVFVYLYVYVNVYVCVSLCVREPSLSI
jgi:hypothetical protein